MLLNLAPLIRSLAPKWIYPSLANTSSLTWMLTSCMRQFLTEKLAILLPRDSSPKIMNNGYKDVFARIQSLSSAGGTKGKLTFRSQQYRHATISLEMTNKETTAVTMTHSQMSVVSSTAALLQEFSAAHAEVVRTEWCTILMMSS